MKNAVVLFLLLSAFTLSAQDNIQWRNDRTGVYKETGLLKSWPTNGPAMLWHYDGLGEGHSSVAIASGKIYLTGLTDGKGYLYVFDLNGKLLNKKAGNFIKWPVGPCAFSIIEGFKVKQCNNYVIDANYKLILLENQIISWCSWGS